MRRTPFWRLARVAMLCALAGLTVFTIVTINKGARADEFAFSKGINVNPWFRKPALVGTWTREEDDAWSYDWPPFPQFDPNSYRRDLESLRATGFNFLRVPIHVGPFLGASQTDRIAEYKNIGQVLGTALKLGFGLMINLHPSPPGEADYLNIAATNQTQERYIAAFSDLVLAIGPMAPEHILFETINEPSTECDDREWDNFQGRIIAAALEVLPDVRLVVTGSCYSSVNSLVNLDPANYAVSSDRLFFTFHYYSPYRFTHQGNSWSGEPGQRLLTGIPWPAELGDVNYAISQIEKTAKATEAFAVYGESAIDEAISIAREYIKSGADESWIEKDFSRVEQWAQFHGVEPSKIIVGEFGVLKRERKWFGADMDSAERWTTAVRTTAEEMGMPWALWSYQEGMALATKDDGAELFPELVRALGLSMPESGYQ